MISCSRRSSAFFLLLLIFLERNDSKRVFLRDVSSVVRSMFVESEVAYRLSRCGQLRAKLIYLINTCLQNTFGITDFNRTPM